MLSRRSVHGEWPAHQTNRTSDRPDGLLHGFHRHEVYPYQPHLLEQQGIDTISPFANSAPIASIILRKNSKSNDRTQLQSIPVQWQLVEIQHSGEETFADWLHECAHWFYPICHHLTILVRI